MMAKSISFLILTLTVFIYFTAQGTAARSDACSSTVSCTSGCCSTAGFCGFGPEYCGESNCTSGCDAVAECGPYAPSGSEKCPLNVCCSQYGFCGATDDYCGSGCQDNCGAVLSPTCKSSASSDRRRIGYYSSESSTRSCDPWFPEDIDPFAWTHINYAFALIDSNFTIAAANSYDEDFYRRIVNLKVRNPALKVYISVGGWGAGGEVFSNMVSNATTRGAFMTSAIKFMKTYAFDGIDIDWEYPAASDRGGTPADTENYVQFLKELKSAYNFNFGVTLTLPISYWYLQGFDIASMEPYVDWFNFMSYDIHGTWDGNSPGTQAVVQAHTNLTEISQGLELLWRNNISPSKVVLGLSFYGRSFTLKDASCNSPGCPFSGGANPGECTGTSGILSNAEIASIIQKNSIIPTLDEKAAVKYITWNEDQWVSYDDWETYNMKKVFADKLCLGGTMVWSLDLEDPLTRNSSMSLAADRLTMPGEDLASNPTYYQARFAAHNLAKNYEQATFWTDCQSFEKPQCPVGYKVIAYGHGKVFDADQGLLRGNGCHGGGKGWNRALCAPSNFQGRCEWFGTAKSCQQGCPAGYWRLTQNSHVGFERTGCQTGRYASFCCQDLYASAFEQAVGSGSSIADFLSGGQALRDSALRDNPARQDLLPESQRNSANESQYSLSTYGYYDVGIPGHFSMNDTNDTAVWIMDSSNHSEPSSSESLAASTVWKIQETTVYATATKVCDCAADGMAQQCYHYSSEVQKTSTWSILECPTASTVGRAALAAMWNQQHDARWSADWIPQTYSCRKDVFPPSRFARGIEGGYIRLLPRQQNATTNGFDSICPSTASTTSGQAQAGSTHSVGRRATVTSMRTDTVTVSRLDIQFENCTLTDYGLTANPCWPSILTSNPGFALLAEDQWYASSANQKYNRGTAFAYPPGDNLTDGQQPLNGPAHTQLKRDFGSNDLFLIDSRPTSDEELLRDHGLLRCEHEDCGEEAMALGLDYTAPPTKQTVASSALSTTTPASKVSSWRGRLAMPRTGGSNNLPVATSESGRS